MPAVLALVLTLLAAAPLRAQSSATLQGRVFDPSDAVIPGATITVRSPSTGFDRSVRGDAEGRYHVVAIPVGIYTVTAAAAGFRSERIDALTAEVGRILVRDFHLEVARTRFPTGEAGSSRQVQLAAKLLF